MMDESQEYGEKKSDLEEDSLIRSKDLEKKITEILTKKEEKKSAWFSSPLLLALVGLIGTAVGASVQGYWNTRLEQQKFECNLIVKSLDTEDQQKAANRLKFLLDAGLMSTLKLNADSIDKLAKENKLPLRFGTDPFGKGISWRTIENDESHFKKIEIADDYEKKNIISVTIPQLNNIPGAPKDGIIRFHVKAAESLKRAFAEIEEKGLLKHIKSWEGGYYPIAIRHSEKPGSHAFGIAFDINAKYYSLGRLLPKGTEGSVEELVPIFEKYGFRWGGRFAWPDGMHFQYDIKLAVH